MLRPSPPIYSIWGAYIILLLDLRQRLWPISTHSYSMRLSTQPYVDNNTSGWKSIWNPSHSPLRSSLFSCQLPCVHGLRLVVRLLNGHWRSSASELARVWRPAFDTRRNSTSLSRPSLNNTCSAILNDGIFPIWTNIYPTHSFQFPFFLSRNIFQDKKKRKFFKQSQDIFWKSIYSLSARNFKKGRQK